MTMGGRPCTRRHAPAFRTPCAPNILAPAHTSFLLHVIANQCAHWCGNPFSTQGNLANWRYFRQIRDALRMRPKCCYFAMPHRRRSGLPRRFAPRNDMQKHAAVRMSNYVLPGQIRSFSVFALGTAFRHAPPQGERIATPVCALVRNDMLKHAGVHMAMTWYHGKFVTFFVFAQSTAPPCRRGCGLPRRFAPRNDMLKHAGVHMAMTWYHGKFVTFFVFAQSTAPPCRRGCGLPRRSAPRNDMQKEGRVRRCKDVGREGVQKAGTCAQVQGRGARGRAEGGGVCAGARRGGA